MNPGDMRQRLTFLLPDGGKDDNGYPVPGNIPYAKVWASLKTLKGKTFYAAAQNNMEHNREFTIRYQRKLDEAKRPKNLQVSWKEITHDIESIENDDGLNETMTVVLKAVK